MGQHHHKKESHWFWLIANSLFAFLTMFIGLFFTYYLVQMTVARVFDIQSTLYFDNVLFISQADKWFPKLIMVSYIAPVLFSFFSAIFFYYILTLLKRTPYLLRLYCLWGYIISVALFFCSFIHGVFAYKSFAVILMWYKIPNQFNYLLAIFGVIGLGVVGLFLGLWFLKLTPSQDLNVHKHPRKFLLQFALLPTVLGAAIIVLFLVKKWQDSIPLLVVPSGIFVMLIFTIARTEPLEERITIVKNLPTGRFSLLALLICILFITLAKYLTINGINL